MKKLISIGFIFGLLISSCGQEGLVGEIQIDTIDAEDLEGGNHSEEGTDLGEFTVGVTEKTLSVGNSFEIPISGGTGEYLITSSSEFPGYITENVFVATGVGSTTLTISDGAEQKQVQVTVKGADELFSYQSGTCAKLSSGEIQCFGADKQDLLSSGVSTFDGKYGKFSPKTTTAISQVWKLSGGKHKAFHLIAGNEHFCYLKITGAVFCFGEANYGLMGQGSYSSNSSITTTPVTPIGLDSNVVDIVGGRYSFCALKSSGHVYCWGYNYAKLVLNSSYTTGTGTPSAIASITDIQAIKGSDTQYCALNSSGSLFCWGDYLGDGYYGSGAPGVPPTAVTGVTSVERFSVGEDFVCAINTSGAVYCWGSSSVGKLGTDYRISSGNVSPSRGTPVPVNIGAETAVEIASANRFTCVLTAIGSVKCWGDVTPTPSNSDSQNVLYNPTTMIEAGADQIVSGQNHICVRLGSGEVRCIGSNEYGQTGLGENYGSAEFLRPNNWE